MAEGGSRKSDVDRMKEEIKRLERDLRIKGNLSVIGASDSESEVIGPLHSRRGTGYIYESTPRVSRNSNDYRFDRSVIDREDDLFARERERRADFINRSNLDSSDSENEPVYGHRESRRYERGTIRERTPYRHRIREDFPSRYSHPVSDLGMNYSYRDRYGTRDPLHEPRLFYGDRYLNEAPQSKRRMEKAPKFDGKCDLSDFIVQFEQVAEWNGWTDSEKTTQILLSLDGPAKQMLSELTADKMGNYSCIKQVLTNRFNPVERETAYRCEFKSRRRQKGESLQDYGNCLRKLALKGYPNTPYSGVEAHVIDQFIQGISNPKLREHVQFKHPETLDKAVAVALEYESFVGPSDVVRKPQDDISETICPVKQLVNKSSDIMTTEKVAQICRNVIRQELAKFDLGSYRAPRSPDRRNIPFNRPGRRIICYYCKEEGHVEPMCPVKREDQNKRDNKNQGNC
ncbi:hypothetical protein FSP39_012572 [Pinctada imbricata]|uniref:CCHC-type domain-containing protein n=1 Tax=Pinctada imbricata TaxID=66713 RepID=A0AA88YDU3_PINIB|nr:hypothetical protein FSP39_012572 [Pinctada imbricata]